MCTYTEVHLDCPCACTFLTLQTACAAPTAKIPGATTASQTSSASRTKAFRKRTLSPPPACPAKPRRPAQITEFILSEAWCTPCRYRYGTQHAIKHARELHAALVEAKRLMECNGCGPRDRAESRGLAIRLAEEREEMEREENDELNEQYFLGGMSDGIESLEGEMEELNGLSGASSRLAVKAAARLEALKKRRGDGGDAVNRGKGRG